MWIWGAFSVPLVSAAVVGTTIIQQPYYFDTIYNERTDNTVQRIRLGQNAVTGSSSVLSFTYQLRNNSAVGGTVVFGLNFYSDSGYSSLVGSCAITKTIAGLASVATGTYAYEYNSTDTSIVGSGDCLPPTNAVYDELTFMVSLPALSDWSWKLFGVNAAFPFWVYQNATANMAMPMFAAYGQISSIDPNLVNVGNPSGISTSTIRAFCNGTYATSTGFFSDIANGVTYGACTAFSFLFVPDQNTLRGFSELSSTTQTKIPFSYYYDFAGILNGSSASTTSNFTVLSADLRATGVGSTTPWGNVLPSSFNYLSSTTITAYVSPTLYSLLFLLMRSAIWLAVLFHIYHRLVPRHATHV